MLTWYSGHCNRDLVGNAPKVTIVLELLRYNGVNTQCALSNTMNSDIDYVRLDSPLRGQANW